jgi:hypothetical protein
MPRIPKTEEWIIGYRMSYVAIMEPQETLIGRIMRQPSVRTRLLMKVKPLEVELEGWDTMHSRVPLQIYNEGNGKEHI